MKTTQRAECGDCVRKLLELDTSPALIIGDPPYNIGAAYDAHADNLSYDEYMTWTKTWIAAATQRITPYGSMWIFIPDEWVSEIDLMCRQEFKWHKRRHVVWAFTFGQRAQKNFTRSHCHLLWLTKHRTRYTYNADKVAVPSARQLVYNDKRADPNGKPPDATWMLLREQLEPYMTPDTDTWLQSRICGTFKERKKHSPNQIPLPIMERIIAATSNKGDLVVDMFAGTGASGVVAKQLQRNWLGFDLSKVCVRESNARIAKATVTT
jgi:site-specific DNA-methyltransferase (adenine-specific)